MHLNLYSSMCNFYIPLQVMTHNQDITGPEANNHIALYTIIVSPIYMGYKYRTNYCNYNIDSYSL